MTLRALVADPTEPLASQLREALLSAGFEVAAAGSLDAAVDVLREEEPQIVFASSSEMFDGALLCARTRALRPTCPVVMVFFPDATDPEQDARAAGADAWIQAPFTPSAVGTLAHAMLGVHQLRTRLARLEKEVRAAATRAPSFGVWLRKTRNRPSLEGTARSMSRTVEVICRSIRAISCVRRSSDSPPARASSASTPTSRKATG